MAARQATGYFRAVIAIFVILAGSFANTAVLAREIDWVKELATDAALVGATLGIEHLAPEKPRFQGDEFPTQSFDDKVHKKIHGKPTGAEATEKENRYRSLSNVTVFTSASLPAVLALINHNDATLGQVITTGHALLLSNFVVTSLKHSVRRVRPKARQNPEPSPSGDDVLSFPSGHAAAAFTGATLTYVFFPQSPWWVKGGAFALATLTALARIEGDKHFLTDVALGGGIGAAAAAAANCFYEEPSSSLSLNFSGNALKISYRF